MCFLLGYFPNKIIKNKEYRHTLLLHFVLLAILCILQSKSLWQPLSKSFGDIFPTTAWTLSLCHILVIVSVFQIFSSLYLLWWFVISDLGVTVVIILPTTSCAYIRQWNSSAFWYSNCSISLARPLWPETSLFPEVQHNWS
jgi:hypothetical protein